MSKTQEPAVQEPEANKAGPELFMIEELKAKKKTSAPIYSGVCTCLLYKSPSPRD